MVLLQYVFNNGKMDLERLKDLVSVVGKERLVLDLSCRKRVGSQPKIKSSLFLFMFYFQGQADLFIYLILKQFLYSFFVICDMNRLTIF